VWVLELGKVGFIGAKADTDITRRAANAELRPVGGKMNKKEDSWKFRGSHMMRAILFSSFICPFVIDFTEYM
jgi:hypothetical protein